MLQLDGLRTLAVAAVMWSHWAPERWFFGLPWGTGVQLFYVLSGFLITGILIDNRPAPGAEIGQRMRVWRRFYIRRALRIFPLFYMVLVATLLIGVPTIRATWPWHFAYASNFYYFSGHPLDPYSHFWSLAVEEQFYLVWPFLTLLLPRRALPATIGLLILIAPVSRIVAVAGGHALVGSRLLPTSCLDALGIGALLAAAKRTPLAGGWTAKRLARACLVLGLAATVGFKLLGRRLGEPYWADSLMHSGLVISYGWVVLSASSGFRGPVGAFLEHPWVLYLGRVSYGIYVFHHFMPLLTSRLPLQGLPPAAATLVVIAANTAITLVLAAVSWRLYEKPLNDLKRLVPYR